MDKEEHKEKRDTMLKELRKIDECDINTDNYSVCSSSALIKRGKRCERVYNTVTVVSDLRQTAEDRKESSIRSGGTRKKQSRTRGGRWAFSSNARRKRQYQENERQYRGARAKYGGKRRRVWFILDNSEKMLS